MVWHSHLFEGNSNTLFGSEARAPTWDFRRGNSIIKFARVIFQVRVVMLE